MKVLSLFSGVGGFDMGLENAGMQTVFQCEWDKHANTILNKHWPHVPKWEDVSSLTGKHILSKAPVIDIVAWGSPCQDLSVAGKRSGLEGERSGLFHQGIRIIKELRKETNGQYPRISIWENVVGALNSNRGADFGIILNEMAEAGAMVIEWAVLDAQYFGVPQRRRRVFVIAIFDPVLAERCPSPLLPVAESLPRHLTKSKPKRQSTTSTTPEGVGSSSRMRGFGDYISDDTASAIKARDHKDATDLVIEQDDQLTTENRPILIDRAAFNQGENALYQPHISDDPISPSLVAQGPHAIATSQPMLIDGTRVNDVRIYEEPVQTLKERMGTGGNNVPMLAFDTQFGSNANVTENVAPTLKSSQAPPSVAYNAQSTMAVRRLTPLECERLMGWPDDHTRYKADGTEQADTHRYKQCGNGVASPVAEWIGEQLRNL